MEMNEIRSLAFNPPPPATSKVSTAEALLDSQQAAQLLRIHPRTLQRLARQGELPALQIGRLWRYRASDLTAWVQSRTAQAQQTAVSFP